MEDGLSEEVYKEIPKESFTMNEHPPTAAYNGWLYRRNPFLDSLMDWVDHTKL